MEKGLTVVYNHILDNTHAVERSVEENINLIKHTLNQYRKDIEELKENINSMTSL